MIGVQILVCKLGNEPIRSVSLLCLVELRFTKLVVTDIDIGIFFRGQAGRVT